MLASLSYQPSKPVLAWQGRAMGRRGTAQDLRGTRGSGSYSPATLSIAAHVLSPTNKIVLDSALSQVNGMEVQDFALLLPF